MYTVMPFLPALLLLLLSQYPDQINGYDDNDKIDVQREARRRINEYYSKFLQFDTSSSGNDDRYEPDWERNNNGLSQSLRNRGREYATLARHDDFDADSKGASSSYRHYGVKRDHQGYNGSGDGKGLYGYAKGYYSGKKGSYQVSTNDGKGYYYGKKGDNDNDGKGHHYYGAKGIYQDSNDGKGHYYSKKGRYSNNNNDGKGQYHGKKGNYQNNNDGKGYYYSSSKGQYSGNSDGKGVYYFGKKGGDGKGIRYNTKKSGKKGSSNDGKGVYSNSKKGLGKGKGKKSTHPIVKEEEIDDGHCLICSRQRKKTIDSLTFRYNAQGSDSSYQHRAECKEDTYPQETFISFLLYGKEDSYIVSDGDIFTVRGPFRANTEIEIIGYTGPCSIHTSCLEPLVVGDQIGPFEILSAEPGHCNHSITTLSPTAVVSQDKVLSTLPPISLPIITSDPTTAPSVNPTPESTQNPTPGPISVPSISPIILIPSSEPTPVPTIELIPVPTLQETFTPTLWHTIEISSESTPGPTSESTSEPTLEPTLESTLEPTPEPTPETNPEPTPGPTIDPTPGPTLEPTSESTPESTQVYTLDPTENTNNDPQTTGSSSGNNLVETCDICSASRNDDVIRITEIILEYSMQGKTSLYQQSTCTESLYPENPNLNILLQNDLEVEIPVYNGYQFEVKGIFNEMTTIEIQNPQDDTITSCTIDTSCSRPLMIGDQIGPFKILGSPLLTTNCAATSTPTFPIIFPPISSLEPVEGSEFEPTPGPIPEPTIEPFPRPTPEPSVELSPGLTPGPTVEPSPRPTTGPTVEQSPRLTPRPTVEQSPRPTPGPTVEPSPRPTPGPTVEPSPRPTPGPTVEPSPRPTPEPTVEPSPRPTPGPTVEPSPRPTPRPTVEPSPRPTPGPTVEQSPRPTPRPTVEPSPRPTPGPTAEPSPRPTPGPTVEQSPRPTLRPIVETSLETSPRPTPAPTSAPIISALSSSPTSVPCIEISIKSYQCGDPITVNFNYKKALNDDWIGIYSCEVEEIYRHAIVWQWSCGSTTCRNAVQSGSVTFDSLPYYNEFGPHQWPVVPYRKTNGDINRCFKAVLLREDGPSVPPYEDICESNEIIITENENKTDCKIRDAPY